MYALSRYRFGQDKYQENMESTMFQSISEQIGSKMFQTLSEQIGLPQSLQSNLALAIEENPWNLGLFKLLVQNPNG